MLDFKINKFDFESLGQFGKDHAFARFPLSGEESGFQASSSPWSDPAAAARAVAEQNLGLAPPEPHSRYILAGQQPGLLTGPLYTFLKGVSVLSLSTRMPEERLCPLFWIASEDHDVLEVNHFHLNGQRFEHPFDGALRRGSIPQVGEIPLESARGPLLDFLKNTLPETEFRSPILDGVAAADFSNYATAFSSLLDLIFEGFPLYRVDPRLFRELTAPVLAALVERWPEVTVAFEEGSSRLEKRGVKPPLERAGLFEVIDGRRVPVAFKEKTMVLCGREVPFREGAEEIRARPRAFSPNAALRPILQDAVLPVRAFVAGPSELLYLMQIRLIYDVANVRPSKIYPRISATFVEHKILAAAERAGLTARRIFEAPEALRKMEAGPSPSSDAVERKGKELLDTIEGISEAPMPKWLAKSLAALDAQLEKMVRRLREEADADTARDRARLEKVIQALLPRNRPQERVVNVLQFLNLYGPEFVKESIRKLDPFSSGHQAVFMKTEKE